MTPTSVRSGRFPPGESVRWSRPGDFILISGTSWRSRITSAYERLYARTRSARKSARWNHAALFIAANGVIVEAGTAGVVLQHVEKYRDVDYYYVAVEAGPDERRRAARFAATRVGSPYNRLALVNLALFVLTRGKVQVRAPNTDLCGSLVANALACAGERFQMPPAEMLPADLATHYPLSPG